MIKTGKRRGSVRQLNVKRVQEYMKNLPTDENGNLIVDKADLENIKDAFFGHNRENNKSLLQMIEELAEE